MVSVGGKRRGWVWVAVLCLVLAAVAAVAMRAKALISYTDQPLPEISTGATQDNLGPYYLFLLEGTSGRTVTDAEEQILAAPWQPPTSHGVQTHPIVIAQDGLHNLVRYNYTGDERFVEHAEAAAKRLLELQNPDGSWRFDFVHVDKKPGWTSAMAQGQAISLLLRLDELRPDSRYIPASKAAYEFMMTSEDTGGTTGTFADGTPVLEEFPADRAYPHILNGSIFSLLGLRDYALVTGDSTATAQWTALSSGLASKLDLYDTGKWTLYSLPTYRVDTASPEYHYLHIAEARVMYELTGDRRWETAADRWDEYRHRVTDVSAGTRVWRALVRRIRDPLRDSTPTPAEKAGMKDVEDELKRSYGATSSPQ